MSWSCVAGKKKCSLKRCSILGTHHFSFSIPNFPASGPCDRQQAASNHYLSPLASAALSQRLFCMETKSCKSAIRHQSGKLQNHPPHLFVVLFLQPCQWYSNLLWSSPACRECRRWVRNTKFDIDLTSVSSVNLSYLTSMLRRRYQQSCGRKRVAFSQIFSLFELDTVFHQQQRTVLQYSCVSTMMR